MALKHLLSVTKCLGDKLACLYPRKEMPEKFAPDVPLQSINTYKKVQPYTMTSAERIFSLCDAVKYIYDQKIEGDIVECGVWKGGSMMAIAETLINLGDTSRYLYLFDTFEGMTPPSKNDVDISGIAAEELLSKSEKTQDTSVWCCAGLDVVKQGLGMVNYPKDKIHYVQGMVEETIPEHAPEKIALLRLDTDWYESTKHEMEHLFPRLVKGGILIIDDYGHWQGARKAVDEYLAHNQVRIFLNRIDYTGRIAVKID
jgi:O-methyltransferase